MPYVKVSDNYVRSQMNLGYRWGEQLYPDLSRFDRYQVDGLGKLRLSKKMKKIIRSALKKATLVVGAYLGVTKIIIPLVEKVNKARKVKARAEALKEAAKTPQDLKYALNEISNANKIISESQKKIQVTADNNAKLEIQGGIYKTRTLHPDYINRYTSKARAEEVAEKWRKSGRGHYAWVIEYPMDLSQSMEEKVEEIEVDVDEPGIPGSRVKTSGKFGGAGILIAAVPAMLILSSVMRSK